MYTAYPGDVLYHTIHSSFDLCPHSYQSVYIHVMNCVCLFFYCIAMFSFFISCSDTFLLSWQFSLYVLFSISFEIDCIQYVAYTQMSLLFRGAIFFFFFFFLGGGGGGSYLRAHPVPRPPPFLDLPLQLIFSGMQWNMQMKDLLGAIYPLW